MCWPGSEPGQNQLKRLWTEPGPEPGLLKRVKCDAARRAKTSRELLSHQDVLTGPVESFWQVRILIYLKWKKTSILKIFQASVIWRNLKSQMYGSSDLSYLLLRNLLFNLRQWKHIYLTSNYIFKISLIWILTNQDKEQDTSNVLWLGIWNMFQIVIYCKYLD